MRSKFLFFIVLLMTIVVYSCGEKDIIPQSNNNIQFQRTKPLNNCPTCKEREIDIEDWIALTKEEQKQLWLDKLNFILNDSNLNSTQETYINSLIDEIESLGYNVFQMNQDIKDIALELVDEFSETDFIATFNLLKENELSGTNSPNCSWCASDISSTSSPVGNGLEYCNCRWSCGDPLASYSCTLQDDENCCIPTSTGCGFLWLYSCVGRDEL